MPVRVALPGTNTLPEDIGPTETTEAESNEFSLRAFFYDFCVIPTSPRLSRGYFAGLEPLALRLGPKSDLARACQAVSFGTHGKPMCRPYIEQRAEGFYQQLLGSLARAIEYPVAAHPTESKLIAMLLGLYQVCQSPLEDQSSYRPT